MNYFISFITIKIRIAHHPFIYTECYNKTFFDIALSFEEIATALIM